MYCTTPDVVAFFHNFGGFHDCPVTRISINAQSRTMEIHFEDVFSNFIGLEGYDLVSKPGVLLLKNVEIEFVDFMPDLPKGHPWVWDTECTFQDGRYRMNMLFQNGGIFRALLSDISLKDNDGAEIAPPSHP